MHIFLRLEEFFAKSFGEIATWYNYRIRSEADEKKDDDIFPFCKAGV